MDSLAPVTFEPIGHIYRCAGRVIPHVTGVLDGLTDYSMVVPHHMEIARQRGTAVHALVEFTAQGIPCDTPEWMTPVAEYWDQFCAESGFRMIASERRVYHPTYDYAGTLDLVCELPKTKLKGVGILDVKRSFMGGKTIGYQTAAYAEAYQAGGGEKINWRAALRLREDSPYRLATYPDKGDFSKFLTCLAYMRLKESCK
jgi:hypothetical protein